MHNLESKPLPEPAKRKRSLFTPLFLGGFAVFGATVAVLEPVYHDHLHELCIAPQSRQTNPRAAEAFSAATAGAALANSLADRANSANSADPSSPELLMASNPRLQEGKSVAASNPMLQNGKPVAASNPQLQNEKLIVANPKLQKHENRTQLVSLLSTLKKSKDFLEFHAAMQTAIESGARFEALEAVASRLGEAGPGVANFAGAVFNDLFKECVELDDGNIDEIGEPSIEEYTRVKPHWLKLLKEHQAELQSAYRFKIASLSSDFIPRDFCIQFSNGQKWPAHNESAGTLLKSAENKLRSAEGAFNRNMPECLKNLSEVLGELQKLPPRTDFDQTMITDLWTEDGWQSRAKVKVSVHANDVFVTALRNLADCYFVSGDYEKAKSLYARAIVQRAVTKNQSKVFTVSNQPIPASEILTAYNKVLSTGRDYSGERQVTTHDMIVLAQTYDLQKQCAVAEQFYMAALPHLKSTDFRHVCAEGSNLPPIEAAYKKILALAEQSFGASDARVATRYELLACLYNHSSAPVQAEQMYRKAISLREADFDKSPAMLCFDLEQLKYILDEHGKHEQALALNRRLLQLEERVHGSECTRALEMLQREELPAAENRGDKVAAMKILNRLYTLRLKQGDNGVVSSELMCMTYVLWNMSQIYTRGGASEQEVMQLLARFRQNRIAHPLQKDMEHIVVYTVEDLTPLLCTYGHGAEAESIVKHELALTGKNSPGNVNAVTSLLSLLGEAYENQNKRALAENTFKEALRITESNPAKLDLESGLNQMISFYTGEGRYADAEPLLERQLVLEEKKCRPAARWFLEEMATCYKNTGKLAKAAEYEKLAAASKN